MKMCCCFLILCSAPSWLLCLAIIYLCHCLFPIYVYIYNCGYSDFVTKGERFLGMWFDKCSVPVPYENFVGVPGIASNPRCFLVARFGVSITCQASSLQLQKNIEPTKTYSCIAVPVFWKDYQAALNRIRLKLETRYDKSSCFGELRWVFFVFFSGKWLWEFCRTLNGWAALLRLVINSVFQLWNFTCSRRTFQISTPLGRCWWFHVPRKPVDCKS